MSEYEIRDLVRYLHNVKKKDGSANPIIGEDELGVVAILSYLLEDSKQTVQFLVGSVHFWRTILPLFRALRHRDINHGLSFLRIN